MPRDGAGTYTLPAGNPVVSGTVIDSTWANPTLTDIANQLNNVLTRDGLLGPTTQFRPTAGTVGTPGIGWSTEPASGFYRIGAGQTGVSIGGVLVGTFTSTGFQGAVGATTPAAGAFTTLAASGVVSGAGFTALFAAPPSIGATTPNSANFSGLSIVSGTSGQVRLVGGGGSNTGYMSFESPTSFVRQGYIGFSTSTGAIDTGTIPYVAGTHSFSGNIIQNGVAIPTLSLPIDSATGASSIPTSANGRAIRQTDSATRTVDTATAGQIVTVINDSSNLMNLTQGSGVTLRLTGSSTSGNRQINQRGVCTLLWATSSVVYASGPGVL